jgi:hypothetical protein
LPNRRAFRPPPEPEPAAEETAHEEETTMAYEQKDMSGALFKNTDKKGDKSPDYTGSVMIGGQVYYLSAWIKTSQAGTKYMSLSFKLKDDQRQGASARRHDDSDIRF